MKRLFFPWKTKEKKARFARAPHDYTDTMKNDFEFIFHCISVSSDARMSFEPGVKHTMQNLVWGGGKGWTARHIDYYVPGLGPLLLRGGFGT